MYSSKQQLLYAIHTKYKVPIDEIDEIRITSHTISRMDPVTISFVHNGKTLGTGIEQAAGTMKMFYGEISSTEANLLVCPQ